MSAEPTWPPPPRPDDRYQRAAIWQDGVAMPVRLRVVRLWGRNVLVDEQARVHCGGCLELVPVDELARPDNGHRVGLPFRADGRLVPRRDDDTP